LERELFRQDGALFDRVRGIGKRVLIHKIVNEGGGRGAQLWLLETGRSCHVANMLCQLRLPSRDAATESASGRRQRRDRAAECGEFGRRATRTGELNAVLADTRIRD